VDAFPFAKVLFVAAIASIALQCLVYPVRRYFGMSVAYTLLKVSLWGFVAVAVEGIVWAGFSGSLRGGLAEAGWRPLADLALFVGFSLFVSYFMASRYLADELERARGADESAMSEAGAEALGAGIEPRSEG